MRAAEWASHAWARPEPKAPLGGECGLASTRVHGTCVSAGVCREQPPLGDSPGLVPEPRGTAFQEDPELGEASGEVQLD